MIRLSVRRIATISLRNNVAAAVAIRPLHPKVTVLSKKGKARLRELAYVARGSHAQPSLKLFAKYCVGNLRILLEMQ